MTYGSLFAGIGGFDLGFERAGMVCKWQVEINEFCRRVLAKHWPNVRRHDDVKTFPPEGSEHDEFRVDVICGGFPCKQTSTAAAISGNRVGLDGKDSGLWFHMLRIVRALLPETVVVENPPSKWLATVQDGLAKSGYRWVYRVERTAEGVGAPHLRRRVFVIADRQKSGLALARSFGPSSADSQPRGTSAGNSWVSALAGGVRVADGVPGGVDRRERINAVGNAVVPQVAEWIGRRLIEHHTGVAT